MRYWMIIGLLCWAGLLRAEAPPIAAKAYVLVDEQSGAVLAERQGNSRLEVASLTKLMTAYLVFEALKTGQLRPDTRPPFSLKAFNQPGSRLPLDPKQPARVDELLRGMIVLSANDAAMELAEAVAGNEDAFVERMNDRAERLGLTNTHYANPTGQPAPQHYSSARDVARLASRLIRDFPAYFSLYKQRELSWQGLTRPNHNLLLWRDPTVDGLKTGSTASAGYCLAATAQRAGRRLIAVVLGSSSEEARAIEAQKLLNYGYAAFETPRLYAAGQELMRLPVYKGEVAQLALKVERDSYLTVPQGAARRLGARLEAPTLVTAPVRRGQVLGQVVITLDGREVSRIPAVAGQDIASAGWWGRLTDGIKLWWRSQ